MDIRQAWKILEMEPTEDSAEIKKQYRSLLPKFNPEDDPEGFKALREAYELALNPPKEEEKKEKDLGDDEIGGWLKRVDAVYKDMPRRADTDCWEELLSDPLCQGLDTAFELRERLLVYIMDHQFLPHDVWKLLERDFRFKEEKSELLEKFPENFLDYVIYQCESDTFGNYKLFSADTEDPDYDGYIGAFYAVNKNNNILENELEQERIEGGMTDQRTGPVVFLTNEQLFEAHPELVNLREDISKAIKEMDAFGIHHPYSDVERLRFAMLMESEQTEEGRDRVELAEELISKYEESYIQRVAGEVLAEADRWDEAMALWDKVIEKIPDHGMTHLDRAKYYFHLGDYETAENVIRDNISSMNGSPAIKNFFVRIQLGREKTYLQKTEEDPEDLEAWIELCWSRFHSDRIEEVLKMLDERSYVPGTSEYYDYVDMKGRCLLELGKYEEALDYLKKWQTALAELQDDGSEKYKKRQRTLGYQYFVLGECYGHLAIHRKDDSLFAVAEEHINRAIECETDASMLLPYKDLLQRVYLREGKYSKVVDDCTAEIEKDKGNLPAYLRRQEAFYRLHDGQGVVDDYHNILGIYRDYFRPYLLAMRVFMIYNQRDDARKVLEAAAQSGVSHPLLAIEELKLMRRDGVKDRMELFREKADDLIRELEEEGEEDDPEIYPEDVITKDHVFFELASANVEYDDFETALKIANERIAAGTKLKGFYMLRASIYRIQEKYDEAIRFYRELAENDPENPVIWYDYGLCYKNKGQMLNEAIECFEKTLKLDPEEDRAVFELAKCYQQRYQRYETIKDYEEAKRLFDRLVELNPSAFVYSTRADHLKYMAENDAAIEDLKMSLEKSEGDDSDDSYRLYRIGDLHYLNRRTEEAEKIFRECIDKYGTLQSAPIYQLADTMLAKGKPAEAVEIMERFLDAHKEKTGYYTKLADMYVAAGKGANARGVYDLLKKKDLISEYSYLCGILDIVLLTDTDNFMKEMKELLPKIRKAQKLGTAQLYFSPAVWFRGTRREIAEAAAKYFWDMGDKLLYVRELKKASDMLQKALDLKNRLNQNTDGVLRSLSICFKLLAVKYRFNPAYENSAKMYAKIWLSRMIRKDHVPKNLRDREDEKMGTEEYYLKSYTCDNAMRYERLALAHLILGDEEICEKYLAKTESCNLCLQCRFQECYDALLVRAYMAEIKRDRETARKIFAKTAEINPSDIENVGGMWANS
ncbi:MAG: tetratricopeptide repeat protein [Lachnospiraceae bacterium]|nr:tetratricopeptide repeat protein [Lachnospiraceae bacterium]